MTSEKIRKAVIPAAGLGTRLAQITLAIPKEMLPVGKKPVIHHVVDELISAGIEQILIIVSMRKGAILDYFGLLKDLPAQIYFARQAEPKGLADAVSLGEALVGGEDFVVALGDSVITSRNPRNVTQRLIDLHTARSAGATIAVEKVHERDVPRYGIVDPVGQPGDEFEIKRLVEKPSLAEAPSDLAVAARYVFRPEIFDFIRNTKPGRNNELQLTDSIQLMLESGAPGWCVRMSKDEVRYDVGSHETYREVFLAYSQWEESSSD